MSEMAMFFGESRYIEYKREVPKDSLKYMKSVVAFANGDGGQIIFGVEDNTEKVIGVPAETLFQTMDALTNAVTDSCPAGNLLHYKKSWKSCRKRWKSCTASCTAEGSRWCWGLRDGTQAERAVRSRG